MSIEKSANLPWPTSDEVPPGAMIPRRSASRRVAEGLIGGLRSTYRIAGETETCEAFADLIARLHASEDRKR